MLSGDQQRVSAEHQQCKKGVWVRRLVPPEIAGIMKRLCWDFKVNGWSFPVVMVDTGLHVQAKRTHTLSHTFLSSKPLPMNTTSFDGIAEPRRRRNTSLDVE